MTLPTDNTDDPSGIKPEQPAAEPLTLEEKERYLARVRAQARSLTPEARAAVFGTTAQPEAADPPVEPPAATSAAAGTAPLLDDDALSRLESNFFPELGGGPAPARPRLVHGVIFDLYDTLVHSTRPLDDLMAQGAAAAEAYMRATGMELPADFHTNMVEARRFAEEKSAEEAEEHLADDALSFLLQFFGYPASRMNPEVLRRAVDIFYAPEMTAWQLAPGAREMLQQLRDDGYRLALLANYNCDRVFQRTVDYLNLRPYFDLCLSSASVEYRKPDVRFFRLALDRWDALAYETVVVGDALLDDIRGGIELGALTVLVQGTANPQVAHDNTTHQGQVVPDATINRLDQLPELVGNWS